jgi:hypothetical protein
VDAELLAARREQADEVGERAIVRAATSLAVERRDYDRYGPRMVGSVVSADAVRSTLRVTPA